MSEEIFNIEEYLNSLPEDIETIDISNKNITYLPSLKRFYNLKTLYCDHNKLTQLPELNSSLIKLSCYNNQLTQLPELNNHLKVLSCEHNLLTQLPKLNSSLKKLYCDHNKLTQLPELNSSLKLLSCQHNLLTQLPELNSCLEALFCEENKLTQLPELNSSLAYLYCQNNKFPFKISNSGYLLHEKINEFNLKFKFLKRFKELYYLLKFKSQFRDWLWIKVRLPRIQNQYHPDNLDEFLCCVNDEDLDERLDNW